MIIEVAQQEDIPIIRLLADESWRAHYPGIITVEQIDYMLDWMYSEDKLSADMTKGVEFLLVNNAKALGFAGWELIEEGEVCVAMLHKLYLIPEAHGRGFGRKLIAEVTARAKARGAKKLALYVNKYNAKAISAYEASGFERVEAVCNDIGGGFVMDDYRYEKQIP